MSPEAIIRQQATQTPEVQARAIALIKKHLGVYRLAGDVHVSSVDGDVHGADYWADTISKVCYGGYTYNKQLYYDHKRRLGDAEFYRSLWQDHNLNKPELNIQLTTRFGNPGWIEDYTRSTDFVMIEFVYLQDLPVFIVDVLSAQRIWRERKDMWLQDFKVHKDRDEGGSCIFVPVEILFEEGVHLDYIWREL